MTTVGRYKLSGFLISDDFFYIESRDIISFFLQTEFSKHRIFVTLIGGAHNIKARFKI